MTMMHTQRRRASHAGFSTTVGVGWFRGRTRRRLFGRNHPTTSPASSALGTASSGTRAPLPQAASRWTGRMGAGRSQAAGAAEQPDADLQVSDCLAVDPSLVQPVIPDPQVVRLMKEVARPKPSATAALRAGLPRLPGHLRTRAGQRPYGQPRRSSVGRLARTPNPVRDLVVAPRLLVRALDGDLAHREDRRPLIQARVALR